jgi:hypothetical protein
MQAGCIFWWNVTDSVINFTFNIRHQSARFGYNSNRPKLFYKKILHMIG